MTHTYLVNTEHLKLDLSESADFSIFDADLGRRHWPPHRLKKGRQRRAKEKHVRRAVRFFAKCCAMIAKAEPAWMHTPRAEP